MKLIIFVAVAVGAAALVYHNHLQQAAASTPDNGHSGVAEFDAAIAGREVRRQLKVRPVRFYAMGDTPYSQTEKENLPHQLALLDPTADFTIHLGDMQDRYVHLGHLQSRTLHSASGCILTN